MGQSDKRTIPSAKFSLHPLSTNDNMSRPPIQTTLYSLDRTESLTASHVADDQHSVEKTEKPADPEAPAEHSPIDIDQDDGVTRIEALCTLSLVKQSLTNRSCLWQGLRSLCALGFDWSHRLCLLAQSKHHGLLYVYLAIC